MTESFGEVGASRTPTGRERWLMAKDGETVNSLPLMVDDGRGPSPPSAISRRREKQGTTGVITAAKSLPSELAFLPSSRNAVEDKGKKPVAAGSRHVCRRGELPARSSPEFSIGCCRSLSFLLAASMLHVLVAWEKAVEEGPLVCATRYACRNGASPLPPTEKIASAAGLPSLAPRGVRRKKRGCHGRTRRRSQPRREEEGERHMLPLLEMAFPQAATGSAMSLRRRKDHRHCPRPNAIDELPYLLRPEDGDLVVLGRSPMVVYLLGLSERGDRASAERQEAGSFGC
nr:hypothetical protein Iba_chr11aCG13900 [Ipomoea batatas]